MSYATAASSAGSIRPAEPLRKSSDRTSGRRWRKAGGKVPRGQSGRLGFHPVSVPAYDRIGIGYSDIRRPDLRIAARIEAALGDAQTILNVGAGTGSYEPFDREVTAVEPSAKMIAQRPAGAAPVVQASAESLPFEDDSFDAAMALMTMHHWANATAGLAEMKRIARNRIVLLTIDADALRELWITRDYFPETIDLDAGRFPAIVELCDLLPGAGVEPLPVPRDCSDGFGISHWGRPEVILDPVIRRASSNWHEIPAEATERGLQRLRADLKSGFWDERYGHLRTNSESDVGLRLVVAKLEHRG